MSNNIEQQKAASVQQQDDKLVYQKPSVEKVAVDNIVAVNGSTLADFAGNLRNP